MERAENAEEAAFRWARQLSGFGVPFSFSSRTEHSSRAALRRGPLCSWPGEPRRRSIANGAGGEDGRLRGVPSPAASDWLSVVRRTADGSLLQGCCFLRGVLKPLRVSIWSRINFCFWFGSAAGGRVVFLDGYL